MLVVFLIPHFAEDYTPSYELEFLFNPMSWRMVLTKCLKNDILSFKYTSYRWLFENFNLLPSLVLK